MGVGVVGGVVIVVVEGVSGVVVGVEIVVVEVVSGVVVGVVTRTGELPPSF